jgi:hypothetical protein
LGGGGGGGGGLTTRATTITVCVCLYGCVAETLTFIPSKMLLVSDNDLVVVTRLSCTVVPDLLLYVYV